MFYQLEPIIRELCNSLAALGDPVSYDECTLAVIQQYLRVSDNCGPGLKSLCDAKGIDLTVRANISNILVLKVV